jgi:hypothetical protein
MINFIPKALTAEEDGTCPICPVRLNLEALLEDEQARLRELFAKLLTNGTSLVVSQAVAPLPELFASMTADYRVAYGLNLAIWFAAEQYGRAKKVPDLLAAYEEYRTKAKASFAQYDEAVQLVLARGTDHGVGGAEGELGALSTCHADLVSADKAFWVEVDKWTDGRREEAFKIV